MDVNIIIFGDSIVYGAWDYNKVGWVNRLRLLFEQKYTNYYTIFNLGIPGDTTSNIKKRFKQECSARYNPGANNIIIFSMGINDSQIIDKKNNIDIENFKNNIYSLIKMAKEYTNNILFVGLTSVNEAIVNPLPWDKNISYLNEEIRFFDYELKNICEQSEINYINISNLLSDEDLEDGIHPNNIGHEKICKQVYKYLEENIFKS